MDIPINVDVVCASELCGRSTYVIVNPVTDKVTHIVVTEKDFPYQERLVPVSKIFDANSSIIQLHCRKKEFSNMELFEETDFISSGIIESSLTYSDPFFVWPYGLYEEGPIEFEHKHIPANEIAIRRSTPVFAQDEKVGKVDEFVVDPKSDRITHLVLREGHLWGKKDVSIPISAIDKITEDGVYLNMDKQAVEALPVIPVERKWE